jgi:hypothetical protein
MRRPEVLVLIAAVCGLLIGKLIRNFKWGMLVGLFVAAIYAFVTRPERKK